MAQAKKKATKAAPKAATKSDEGKTFAIIAYLTFVGWIISLILNSEKKYELTRFHLRQALIIFLTGIVFSLVNVIPILGQIVWFVVGVALFIFWIMGFIAAINGQEKEVPVIGKLGQEWFKGL